MKTVEHLAVLLTGVGAEYIHGGIGTDDDDENLESREAIIRRFNDPDSPTRVLAANPAACSEGISLLRTGRSRGDRTDGRDKAVASQSEAVVVVRTAVMSHRSTGRSLGGSTDDRDEQSRH